MKSEPKIYLDIEGLATETDKINSINWEDFDIPNYQHFHKLGKYTDNILDLKNLLKTIDDIYTALKDYDKIKFQIDYINQALDTIEESEILKTNIEKVKKLFDIKENIEKICKNTEEFIKPVSRVNINGQFDIFKNIYINELYFPAHEKYVGKDVNWQILDEIFTGDTYKAISQIVKISKQINDSKFKQLRLKTDELKSMKCTNKSLLDSLKNNPRCQQCFFPKDSISYSNKAAEIEKIEDEFEQLLKEYENVLLTSIREYRDNVKYLDNEKEKQFINKILTNKKFPSKILSNEEITAINKLFKEIDLIPIDKYKFIEQIFPNDEIISVDKLKENFEKTLYDIIGTKDESIVRIKPEDINEDK